MNGEQAGVPTTARGNDPGPTADFPTPQPITEGPGALIGTYKLLQEIGQGGMGVVFLAEQDKPVRRRVALKVIKPGMDTNQVIARFEAERQALALMDHPGIARVLDAGTTESGRPFFVMELVHGIPITQYCDQNRLAPAERLELFISVCQAIQHAHQKGIIHRDVKPSNVLITLVDGKPVPKVIDFGVAKAIDQRLTERTVFTQLGLVVGTLEYMSPEQADLSALGVDTRSDIYSLGVLLYELLTGTTPLERARVRAAGYAEVLRWIKEEEPPKPSARLSELRDALPSISARRKTEPARLRKLVQGELDWIVMKALETDRTRRYETASGLARDVERYLAGDPVEAGPPSATYRLGKFARKHRAALAAAGAFAGLLLLAAFTSTVLAIRASRAESAASHALSQIKDEQSKTRDALIRVQAEQAKTQAALTSATAEEQKARRSAAESRAVLGFFQETVLAATRPQGLEGGLGKDATIRRAVDAAEPKIAQAFRDQPLVEASVRDTLGLTYSYLDEQARAIAQYERSRQLRRDTLGLDHPVTLSTMHNLASAYWYAGRLSEASSLLEQTLDRSKAKLGADNPGTLDTMYQLALVYRNQGRRIDALPLLDEALKGFKAKLGPHDHNTLIAMHQLGVLYVELGRTADGLALLEEALRLKRAKLGNDHPHTINSMVDVANTYAKVGRLNDGLRLMEHAIELGKAKQGPDHLDTLVGMDTLAELYRISGRLNDAVALYEDVVRRLKAKQGPEHHFTLAAVSHLAGTYLDLKRWAEAEMTARECLQLNLKVRPDAWGRFYTMSQLGAALAGQKRYAEAAPLLLQGYDGMKSREDKIPAPQKKRLVESAAWIVALYEAWGKPEKGAEWQKRLETEKGASPKSKPH